MKTVTLGSFTKTRSIYGGTEAWMIAFCYPAGEPVVVKGMSGAVRKYVGTLPPATVCYTYWKNGASRSYWSLSDAAAREGWYLRTVTDTGGRQKHQIFNTRTGSSRVIRRMPRKALAEVVAIPQKAEQCER